MKNFHAPESNINTKAQENEEIHKTYNTEYCK